MLNKLLAVVGYQQRSEPPALADRNLLHSPAGARRNLMNSPSRESLGGLQRGQGAGVGGAEGVRHTPAPFLGRGLSFYTSPTEYDGAQPPRVRIPAVSVTQTPPRVHARAESALPGRLALPESTWSTQWACGPTDWVCGCGTYLHLACATCARQEEEPTLPEPFSFEDAEAAVLPRTAAAAFDLTGDHLPPTEPLRTASEDAERAVLPRTGSEDAGPRGTLAGGKRLAPREMARAMTSMVEESRTLAPAGKRPKKRLPVIKGVKEVAVATAKVPATTAGASAHETIPTLPPTKAEGPEASSRPLMPIGPCPANSPLTYRGAKVSLREAMVNNLAQTESYSTFVENSQECSTYSFNMHDLNRS